MNRASISPQDDVLLAWLDVVAQAACANLPPEEAERLEHEVRAEFSRNPPTRGGRSYSDTIWSWIAGLPDPLRMRLERLTTLEVARRLREGGL